MNDETLTETVYYTPQARLLAAGWQPGDDMARVILQRESLLAALAELGANQRSEDPLTAAVMKGDRAGIVAAVTAHAIGTYLDGELQRFESRVHYLNAWLGNQLSKLIAADPEAVLSSLEGIEDPDGDSDVIRLEAERYIEAAKYMTRLDGRPVRVKAEEHNWQPVPRQILPLVSRATQERYEKLRAENLQKINAATIEAGVKGQGR